jgi:glycine C-acetyltransferase
MPTERIREIINRELKELGEEGREKAPERVIMNYVPPRQGRGPRFHLMGQGEREFIRMNSNGYLGLSQHPRLIEAEARASEEIGVNPGGVRFIDGTTKYHVELEERLAKFHKKEAAKIFSCAYMANLGAAMTLVNERTFIASDELNHNSIVRSVRMASVPAHHKGIFRHNDMEHLGEILQAIPSSAERVIIVMDGVFSMRGDYAPLKEIDDLARKHDHRFHDGVFTVVDDSHGSAAFGQTGRGTPEVTDEWNVDMIVSTLGKGFGAEGGYIAACREIIEYIRQKADTYIYTNPISPGMASAGAVSVGIVDSEEGLGLLSSLRENTEYFRKGIEGLGFETIPGIHPVIPILIRDAEKVKHMVKELCQRDILVTGLAAPIVPPGDDTIRVQISAKHTQADLDYVLGVFKELK